MIDAGFRVEQEVLVADFYKDDRRQVLVAGRDDDHEQHLAIYSLDSTGRPGAEPLTTMNPGPNLIAYDVGRLGDYDALLFIEPGRVLRYSFEGGDFVEFTKIRSMYGQQRSGDILPIDFFRDIDGDGRDDLIVPDTAGYRIRLQKPDGSLGEESLLEESSRMTVTSGVVSFESRPLFSGDVNFDGLTDLGVWRGRVQQAYRALFMPPVPNHGDPYPPDVPPPRNPGIWPDIPSARVPGMTDAVARRMNVETHLVNPFERVPVRPDAAGEISIDEAAPMLLLPLGLALRV